MPNALFKDWLTKHYSGVLDEALSEIDRKGTSVRLRRRDRATGAESTLALDRRSRRRSRSRAASLSR